MDHLVVLVWGVFSFEPEGRGFESLRACHIELELRPRLTGEASFYDLVAKMGAKHLQNFFP